MYQWRKYEALKRFTALTLIFLVLVTFIPGEVFSASEWRPGTKVYFDRGGKLKGSDSSNRGDKYFYNNPAKYTNRWPNSGGTAWLKEDCYSLQTPLQSYTVKAINGGLTKPAYCLEQNVKNPASGNTKYTAEFWKNSPFVGDLYSETVQRGILLTLLYGRQPDASKSDISKLFGVEGANLDDWYIATQALIWEYQQGLRTSASGGLRSYGITKPDYFYSIVSGRKAGEIYKAMVKKMSIHETVPSFTKKTNTGLMPIGMTFDEERGVWKSKVLTDSKNCMQELLVMDSLSTEDTGENKQVKIIRQGETNQYVIETSLDPKDWDEMVFRGQKNVPQITRHDLLTWTANDGTHYQTLATGADDPIHFYFKLTTSKASNPQPGEAPEPALPSFTFDVEKVDKNPGFDQSSGTSHTGMGDAALDSEISLFIDGQLEDTRQLDVNGYSDSPFYFMPWVTVDELEKETVEHRDEEGNLEFTEYIYTGAKTIHTEETKVPDGRFSESESGTGTGRRDHGVIRYRAVCTDKPSGPEYQITYIGPDGKQVTVTDPALVSEDEPLAMEDDKGGKAYVNDNFRGKLQIVKTKDDQNPFTDKENSDNGVKDYSTRSKWTVELKSGGFEDCPYIRVVKVKEGEAGYDEFANTYRVTRDNGGTPADPEHPLTPSSKGQIKILDLPYGTYTVKEIAADAEGYVLETYEVNVSSDGQLISTEINNKAKSNRIKVIKTNSETGKTVRWDADRTAFRIRYKGNPDLADPTDVNNYDDYLPNGRGYSDENQNYIFYADENGEIVLPYAIEYGIYEIEELLVPEGYYVGQYDNKGQGTIAEMGTVNIIDYQGQPVTPPKSFAETVQVRDKKGNKVEHFSPADEVIYNTYGFTVREQDPHVNGEDYVLYYAVIEMANNPVKGKLEILKEGEILAGWNRKKYGDYSIWSAVWGKAPLEDSKFEIYAAADILQSDGVIPVKAFTAADDGEVSLKKVSRDHADVENAREVWEYVFDTGETIQQVSAKSPGSTNQTLTDYFVKAGSGATYEESFSLRNEEEKLTYRYTVSYGLNYAKGGFNYTDIHVTKETISDDYLAEIPVTEPTLKSGDLEVGFVTMNYDGGNRVKMQRLDSETEEEYSGVYSQYNTEDITAVKVMPMLTPPETETEPETEPETGVVFPEIVRPEGWDDVKDEDGNPRKDCYMVSKDGAFQILVREGAELRWIPCTEDGNFYKSYKQEYHMTCAQHPQSGQGFSFSWDEVMELSADIDAEAGTAITSMKGYEGATPKIKASSVYTYSTEDGVTVFKGNPLEQAPVYFLTADGIRSEMFLSGGLTHTKVTVTQSQLKKFAKTLPMVQWFDGDQWETIDWCKDLKPSAPNFEWVQDESNYVKAQRHEVSPEQREVYYTIEIVSANQSEGQGFKVVYPDTTEMMPLVLGGGAEAKLSFASVDDTMVYPIGAPVEVITSNKEGIAESRALPLGEYWVREIASVSGHVNRGKWEKMSVSYKDQYTPVIWDTASFDNEAVSVKIDLEKLFETDFQSGAYGPGSGAVFGIFTAEEMAVKGTEAGDADADRIPADTLVGRMEVTDGKASVTAKLPLGKYYIKETSAPKGYKTNNTKYYFDAVDLLTANQMEFAWKDLGVSGFLTQDGKEGVVVDFDTLYRYETAKVNMDGKTYAMDENAETDAVKVTKADGRTNTKVLVKSGNTAVITWENGAVMTVMPKGQTYTVTLDGPRPSLLETGCGDSENFTVTAEGDKTVITYQPKVTKTNWLGEAVYKYQKPKEEVTEEEKEKITVLELISPEKTSCLQAQVDYCYESAMLFCPLGETTKVTIDEEAVEVSAPYTIKRGQRAVIQIADGTTFTAELDKEGNFYISAAGVKEGSMDTECTLTLDGQSELNKLVNLKNTTAKTYARNNTSGEVLNITIHQVKNDRLPEEPETPTPPGPDNPEKPEKPEEPVTPEEPKTGILKLMKICADTKEALAGAVFEILNEEEEVVWSGITDTDGVLLAEDLPLGKYLYREIKAPAGYELDDTYYPFYLTEEDEILQITMVNQMKKKTDSETETPDNPDIPVTGDSNKLALYVALLFLAAGGFAVSLRRIK